MPLTPEQVWAGNGSNEVLQHLLQAFGGPGRTALGFTPAYSMHPIITDDDRHDVGRRAARRRRTTFDLDAGVRRRAGARARPDVVFLCSPNNPTGTALALDVVEAVHAAAASGASSSSTRPTPSSPGRARPAR